MSLEKLCWSLVTTSNTIYKERIYILNDYFTVDRWTSKKTIKLAQGLRCEEALRITTNLNKKIRLGILETQYKNFITNMASHTNTKNQIEILTRAASMNMLN